MSCPWNKINIPKETLIDLYENQRLSIAQVASKLEFSNGPIHRLLRDYKLKIRTVSQAKEKYFISKGELKNLYLTQKLSTEQIAKKYGCNHVTIIYKMGKYGIKSRGHLGLTPPIKISKEKLEYLYHGRKLSAVKIAKILHRSKGGIERKINNFNIPTRNVDNRACKYKKFDFSGDLSEKAYMIGFRIGDLYITQTKNLILAHCSTTKRNQIRLIKNLFSPYTPSHIAIAKRGTFEITTHLNKTFSFLLPKQDDIELWILENPQYFWAFFAGYSDAEGSLHLSRINKGKYIKNCATFEISSYDKNILRKLSAGLSQFNIQSKQPYVCHPKGTPCVYSKYFSSDDSWRLVVSRKDCLWKLINFWEKYSRHKDKQTAIERVRRNIILRNQLPYCHKINLSVPKII
ncbi:hypothetical protein COV89_03095 [Candidatus Shapirobacteria bacterium CG11_big_fil_rev_8_21_14_0_20_40_12]|uniref:Homing endonuclease LAGLIDADG domain-containing protein n=2 Tax=Candidatus Shapironibacteriota TaxID=1752721 RepID=A0A2H0KHR1_9BACT|nr:MAG: hypothetical protein COV89_03095 [Candidatus Shapirobacteria bacterium CG11_big_fil_rev_8_21_14_0_20_40_12]